MPGGNEDAAIEALFAAERSYSDNEDYEYFPDEGSSSGRNSNSFASGILIATGFKGFPSPTRAPGFDVPVPSSSFRKPTVTIEECPNGVCPP